MRWRAVLIAFLFFVTFARSSSNALILIQPGIAGDQPPTKAYRASGWVLWPFEASPQGHSALLSLVTGLDWRGESDDSIFRPGRDQKFYAKNSASLETRGFFDARRKLLGTLPTFAISGPLGSLRETSLLLAVESGKAPIKVLGREDPLPQSALLVHEASSWADALALAHRAVHALVIEYPAPRNRPWTPFWLFGKGRLLGVPVVASGELPGLVPARSILKLMTSETSVAWLPQTAGEGTVGWLELSRSQAPEWRTCYGFLLAATLSLGLLLVLRERRGMWLSNFLALLVLCPASSVLAGDTAGLEGPSILPVRFVMTLASLSLLSYVGVRVLGKWVPEAHRLFVPSFVSFAVFTVGNPITSPIMGPQGFAGPNTAGLGCWFASAVALAAFARESSLALEWSARLLLVVAFLWALAFPTWWSPERLPFACLPLVALAFGDGVWRWAVAPALPLLGALTTPGILYGLAWKPSGLITFESDVPRLDVSPFASLLISPLFIGTAVLLYLFSLMGDRFLLHQLRRLVSEEPRRGAVLASSAGLALLGLTQPPLMTSALWCAIAGLALLVHDALCYL